MIAYTVTAYFTNASVAQEWVDWLRNGHLAEVLAGGAIRAEVVRMDAALGTSGTPEVRCEARYHFADHDSFATYERDIAPGLRADGLKRFPPERGIRYERTVGTIEFGLPE